MPGRHRLHSVAFLRGDHVLGLSPFGLQGGRVLGGEAILWNHVAQWFLDFTADGSSLKG